MKPTYFDVCSGIGMGSLAAEHAGFDMLGHCEIHPFAQAVLRKHWPKVPIFDDIRQLTSESLRERGITRPIDIFGGWIPCQPSSNAGKKQAQDDDRWLWDEFLRLVREFRPLYLLAENPTGLLTIKNKGFVRILDLLEAEGYEVQTFCFGAWSVGSPQRRDRVFIVGLLVSDTVRERRQQNAGSTHGDESANEGRSAQFNNEPECPVEDVADTSNGGLRRGRAPGARTGATAGGATLGDAEGEPVRSGLCEDGQDGERWRRSSDNDGTVGVDQVDANDTGQQEQRQPISADAGQSELGSGRLTQSGVGRDLTGSTWRLDRPLWPAGRGADQFEHEPPRLAQGGAYRQERLMTLGNMCVPQCIEPILSFIYKELTSS